MIGLKREFHPISAFRAITAAIACGFAGSVCAQVTLPQEYEKYVGSSSTVDRFVDFGDQVNLRDGGLIIRATDIEVPGIGPTVRVTRSFNPAGLGQYFHETSGNAFGAWELEIPRIRTMTSSTLGVSLYSPVGWQVVGANATQKNARCTNFSAPSRLSFPNDMARGWEPYEWWSGYHLVDDRGNDQSVLTRASKAIRPDLSLMTTGNWLIGCLAATTSGEPGEAFYALAPDGTKYWFNHLVYTQADDIQKPLFSEWAQYVKAGIGRGKGSGPTPSIVADFDYIERRYAAMLVTRIEDRFGNWVTYHYTSGKLDSIDASDGRHVGIAYGSPGNATITVGSGASVKTWVYSYTTASPSQDGASQQLTVTHPDGAKWHYALNWQVASSYAPEVLGGGAKTCPFDSIEDPRQLDQVITSPSGASLTIRMTRKRFGRSYVPKECFDAHPMWPDTGIMKYPNEWFAFAVTSRAVSGPGLTTSIWTYAYSPANSSWFQDCATPTSCTSTVWTDVTSPDGNRHRSIFSNRFDETENKLLREEEYAASNQLLRSKDYAYAYANSATSNPYPWPVNVGYDQQTRQNSHTSGQWAPVRHTVTTQQNKSFTWDVPFLCGATGDKPCFDSNARPTKVMKTSTP